MDAQPPYSIPVKKIILGTRGSELALVQTRETAFRLRKAHPGLEIEERIIKTTGDKRLDVSLSAPGALEKGLFTKELEEALLRGEIHAAVHSLKDLPTELPPKLAVGAILEREDDSDCLASKHDGGWQGLPQGGIVATSSLRRKNQLLLLRPDLQTAEIRGNMGTRLRKLLECDTLDGLILAKAAINRLGQDLIPEGIRVTVIEEMLPAPGQGAIGIECLEADAETLRILAAIHHEDTARCVNAEREFLKSLGGGCSLPLGARATIVSGEVKLRAALFQNSGVEWLTP
ncbi:MAG: hydroxymethylbilane synthase [Spartobacteria bacterium]